MTTPERSPVSLNRGGRFNRPRDWQAFERLTRDLFAHLLGNDHADLHGRAGQPQAGVDVYGVDSRNGEMVGVQCKMRDEASPGRERSVTLAQLRREVERARTFRPALDRYVVVSTGETDAALQRAAQEISSEHSKEDRFRVEVHGWDWVEGKLELHPTLAAGFGLVAVIQAGAAKARSPSAIARQIGGRFRGAIRLMNAGRGRDERFTLQSLARHLGQPDWRRLEAIADGTADADEAEYVELANGLALSEAWLVEGKGAPFRLDHNDRYLQAEERYSAIRALAPRRVVFVRCRQTGYGHYDAFLAVERDDVRWHIFRETHPVGGPVGSGGRSQMFDFCRLVRRLDRDDDRSSIYCMGKQLDSLAWERLLEGEVYPGAVLGYLANDDRWRAFANLRTEWVRGEEAHHTALREAIGITEFRLSEIRERATQHDHFVTTIAWGGFSLAKPLEEKGEPPVWTLV